MPKYGPTEEESQRVAQREEARRVRRYFEHEQEKRRQVFRQRELTAAASRAAFRRDDPGATGVRRGLAGRQRRQAEFEARVEERGKTPRRQAQIRATLRRATSASDLLEQVRAMRAQAHTEGVYRSAHNNFVAACAMLGCSSQTYSLEGLTGLALIYVDAWKNTSSGLSDLFSRLGMFAAAAGREWITVEEQAELRSIRLMIERQFPSTTVGAKALTWTDLDPLLARLRPRAEMGDLYAAQIVAMLLVAHECMMRGNEYLERALLVEDVRIVPAGASSGNGGIVLATFLTKTRKDNYDERDDMRIAAARPKEPHHCPRLALERYLELAELGEKDVLFPRRTESGAVKVAKGEKESGFTYSQFTAILRKELALSGVKDAETFVARSMRAGGHTDFAADGMDLRVIGMLGGWKDIKSQARYMRLAMAGLKALSHAQ